MYDAGAGLRSENWGPVDVENGKMGASSMYTGGDGMEALEEEREPNDIRGELRRQWESMRTEAGCGTAAGAMEQSPSGRGAAGTEPSEGGPEGGCPT